MKVLILKKIAGHNLYDTFKPCYDIDLLLLRDFLNSIRSEIGITCYREWLSNNDQDWTGMYSMKAHKELENIRICSEFDIEAATA